MLTAITNYLEFYLNTVKLPDPLPSNFNFFNTAKVTKLLEDNEIGGNKKDSLLYTLRVAKNEIYKNSEIQNYFLTTRRLISVEFERYFIARSEHREIEITNNIVLQLQLCLEAISQPLKEAIFLGLTWPDDFKGNKNEIVSNFIHSYVNFVLNLWQEKLDILSFDGIEREMNGCILNLLQNQSTHDNDVKLQLNSILHSKKEDLIATKGQPKYVTFNISKSVNDMLNKREIANLKSSLEDNGLSSQSVPVFFRLMGYYFGLNKHATSVLNTKVVYPGEEGYEVEETKKPSSSSSHFFKKRHKAKTHQNDATVSKSKKGIKY